jgi:hypothetical protein
MIQAQINAYGPKTTFIGKHPYASVETKPSNLSGVALVQVVITNPGVTCQGIYDIIKKGTVSKIGSALNLRIKYGDVHSKKIRKPHPSGNGATYVLHWYPGKANDN